MEKLNSIHIQIWGNGLDENLFRFCPSRQTFWKTRLNAQTGTAIVIHSRWLKKRKKRVFLHKIWTFPGDPIRLVDPIVFGRISSESDIFHKKPIGFDRVFVGFLSVGIRSGFRRNVTETQWNPVGSGRISLYFRRIPTKSGSDSDR
jgi:hypothetical protein